MAQEYNGIGGNPRTPVRRVFPARRRLLPSAGLVLLDGCRSQKLDVPQKGY